MPLYIIIHKYIAVHLKCEGELEDPLCILVNHRHFTVETTPFSCAVLGFCLSTHCIEKYCNDCSIRVTDCSVRVFQSFVLASFVTYSSATLLNVVNLAIIKAKKCYQEPWILVISQ